MNTGRCCENMKLIMMNGMFGIEKIIVRFQRTI